MSLFAELKRRNVFRVTIAYGIIAWVLAQVSDLAFDNFGSPEWVSKTVLFLLVLGLPLAIFFAWAFELTPNGIKKEKQVDRSESITPKTGRKLDFLIIGVLIIAIGFLVLERIQPQDNAAPNEIVAAGESRPSIAVLPFDNRSNRQKDEFFTTGIHDDLLTTLAKIGSMKVISRTSVMEYKNTTKKIPEIARELGVANILEGGVQRSGNQVRINVQLIDAETDEHLWAEIYDRELTAENLFAIQSEVSNAIASALNAALSPEEQRRVSTVPTQSLEAYEAYLLGRQRWTARTANSTAEAVKLFQKAIDLDPDYAQAYAGLADAYRHQVPYGGLPGSEAFPKAETAVRKALELDDQLGEAYAALGGLLRQMGDQSGAREALTRALELNPNYSAAYNWLGLVLDNEGKYEEALAIWASGLEVDPLSVVLHSNVAFTYGSLGRFDEMKKGFERIVEIDPRSPFAYSGLALYHATVKGALDDAVDWQRQAITADPNDPGNWIRLSFLFLDLNDVGSAERSIDRAAATRADFVGVTMARMFIAMRRGDGAKTKFYARLAEEVAPNDIYDPAVLLELQRADLADGRSAKALAQYERMFPALFNTNGTSVTPANFYAVTYLVQFLRDSGENARADTLLKELEPILASVPVLGPSGSGAQTAAALLLSGKKRQALAALRTAVDAGWRSGWWYVFDHNPLFESLRDEPEFQKMRAEIAADMAEQLKNVRRVERKPTD